MIDRERICAAIDAARAEWAATPMRWGVDDCALACANIYLSALHVDPAASWRGRYHSAHGAKRVLGRDGLVGALDEACAALGWPAIEPQEALMGDLGVGPAVVTTGRESLRDASLKS